MTNTSFSTLKKTRGTSLATIVEETKKMAAGGPQADDRFWQPTVDKAGNGMATIRFLPAPQGEDLPWARMFSHAFQGPTGQWLIEECPTTLGQTCPVCESNSELWNTGDEDNKKIVRKRKRKLTYVANIYVISDPGNPANNGKVFLFKFGKKIFDMINDQMNPQFADESPVNPFDFWEGATFKLKIRNVDDYRNYDKSEFQDPAPLFESDDEMEAIWRQQYSLKELTAPEKYKSAADIAARLEKVVGVVSQKSKSTRQEIIEDDARDSAVQQSRSNNRKATKQVSQQEVDDDMDFFKQLGSGFDDDEIPF